MHLLYRFSYECSQFLRVKKRLASSTLNELIDNLSTQSFTSADIFISPPIDDSEGDSEQSDVEPAADRNSFADHLTRKILAAPAEASICGNVDNEDGDVLAIKEPVKHKRKRPKTSSRKSVKENVTKSEQPVSKKPKMSKSVPETSSKPTVTASQKSLKIAESWRKGRKFTSKIDVASTSRSSTADPSVQVQEPLNLFQMFWGDEFFEYIKQQSELYAKQITPTSLFEVSVNELKVFFAIILLSGYNNLPRRDMYWSLDEDVRNEAVTTAMPRNRFREILR